MEITFKDLQKKVTINPSQILEITKSILRREGVEKASLSIVFVTRQRIKALNKKYLHRDYPTDVLAFNLNNLKLSGHKSQRNSRTVNGEIIISTDDALKNARSFETTLPQELALYVIHGILHLLGFDDHKPQDIKKMRKKENEILDHLGSKIQKICVKL